VDTAAVDIPNLRTSHRATRSAASRRTCQPHRVAWIAGCLSSGEVARTSKSASGSHAVTARDRKAEDETCRRLMQYSALSQVEQQVGRQRGGHSLSASKGHARYYRSQSRSLPNH
jgi:hypothetical protein